MAETDEGQGKAVEVSGGGAVVRQASVDVGGLLSLAVEKDLDVDKLGKLVELQERILERDARSAFFEAVAAFQEECPVVPFNRASQLVTDAGGTGRGDYADLAQVQRIVRAPLASHGLHYTWDEAVEGDQITSTCRLHHVLGHSESASFSGPTSSNNRGVSDLQKVGAASTYCKRRSLMSVLGIVTEADETPRMAGQFEKITPEDVDAIEAKIKKLTTFDRGAFLNWLGVESITDLTRNRLNAVNDALDRKAAKEAAS